MRRKILLVEPNYKNKFPPIALMKLATYHKLLGDYVLFFKGNIKELIIERIADKCIAKLNEVEQSFNWNSKRDIIISFIKSRKKEFLESLNLQDFENEIYLTNWVLYYKDYFWKKEYLRNPEWDRIYVTTLFTFYFDITVKTINELKPLLKKGGMFMVGGVLATLQSNEIEKATGIKPHKGLLNKPGELDNGENQYIVDTLPLDYTILEEIDYKYVMADSYFAYMTRGCIRHCQFCAVKTLEPDFNNYIPLKDRIDKVKEVCGDQRDLLLMDNNVIASDRFDDIIQEIVDCGFERGATYVEPDLLSIAVKNLRESVNDRGYTRKAYSELNKYYKSVKDKELSYKIFDILDRHHLLKFETATKEDLIAAYEEVFPYYEKTLKNRRPRQRKVDFNQGLDARLFNDHVAQQFSRIAIHPLRIAFDNIAIKDKYINAITMCAKYGMNDFSNYLLYNYNDKPDELYERLRINVELCESLNININSFPMKFQPLTGEHSHDRKFIGKYWNIKYIRSIQAILNATKGSVGRGKSFFYRAFGNNLKEFHELLEMPDTYIIYRFFFEWLETKGHPLSTDSWKATLQSLNEEELKEFHDIIYDDSFTTPDFSKDYSPKVKEALKFYKNYRDAIQNENGELYALKKEFDTIDEDSMK